MRRLRNKLIVLTGVLAVFAAPAIAGAVAGFQGPLFGLTTAPNGDLLVADASAGVFNVADGPSGTPLGVPGASDVSTVGRNSMWVSTGAGGDPTTNSGQGLWRVTQGNERLIADLFAFEESVNPDGHLPGHEVPDSNPFDVQSLGGNAALVVDAGGNDLLRITNQGDIEVLAVFPDEIVSTEDLKELAGCPTPAPGLEFVCGLPPAIPGQSVPTSIAIGPDGYAYVGELKGFPAPLGESRIWRVSRDASGADCPNPDCQIVFDGGFTSIIDLAFDEDGYLHVAELDELGWAAVEFQLGAVGGTINSCDVSTLTCTEVETGIPILTAITFRHGELWATRNALIPGLAEVFEVS